MFSKILFALHKSIKAYASFPPKYLLLAININLFNKIIVFIINSIS